MQLLWAALANMLKFLSISYTDTTEAVDRKKKKINQVRKKKKKKHHHYWSKMTPSFNPH